MVGMYWISRMAYIMQDINTTDLFGKYWYMYSWHNDIRFNLIYAVVGIAVPLGIKWIVDRIKSRLSVKR